MDIRPLSIDGAFLITPRQFADDRGVFLEWYRADHLAQVVGHAPPPAQGNLSISKRAVVRGIHVTDVPPGQSKYVACVRGALIDVIVDLRVGSPTFGKHETLRLDDVDRRAVYLAEGLGHGLCAVTDEAVAAYLTSTTYDPERDRAIHPLDPELGIAWPVDEPLLSPRDAAAPLLREAQEQGWLPDDRACRELHRPAPGR
ncbi:dTDP-4-dehydrorhamnose 3,5-epimerase family protein [Micromonospora yasonensis]|uniref:dTDP-4-dehydrorhamnose 3,5-epimerase family protein n=1 Tax=Micromonospora yasonensis TaxID=1128667 RepID=UPI00222F7E6D|nr:dTDP-4-dehydrorhamnose 3,5-epimerase family protein [Micromonospora yasonensis]MCW3842475.1 dTDP-4-dehydrorhamnose 3,5-epimerase family protein [Micromonospora yasonensis]